MEQATQATTPTARPSTDTFAHAHTVAGDVVAQLGDNERPFAVEVEEDFPSGWRVHLKFREARAAGLLRFAGLADVPVTRCATDFGVHLDAFARIENIEVRGSALLNPREMARLERQTTMPTGPAETAPPTVGASQPVPLGASVLAHVPAVTPVEAPGGAQ